MLQIFTRTEADEGFAGRAYETKIQQRTAFGRPLAQAFFSELLNGGFSADLFM